MHEQIDREIQIYGPAWDTVHAGYFSNHAKARPFLQSVKQAVASSQPEVVLDLGGGTGFLLSQLKARGISTGTKLVVLDCSDAQLAEAHQKGFTCLHGSVSDFTRRDVAPEDKRFLFVMRSVLHYFGRQGLSPVLRHLHSQAKAGELFVHQTACFEDGKAAACLNSLYHKMRTNKWYPTVSELRNRMAGAGWRQVDISPAPPLPLTSHDLAGRYRLDGDDVIRIRNEIAEQFGEMDNVFGLDPQGFHASLHYYIFLCAAEPDAWPLN